MLLDILDFPLDAFYVFTYRDIAISMDNIMITSLTPTQLQKAAELFRALGHPLRLKILSNLTQGERSVSDLAADCQAPQAIISQQLRILRMTGLVSVHRKNGFSYYKQAKEQLPAMLHCMETCCAVALDS